MTLELGNEAELDLELRKIWVRVTDARAQDWFKTTAKQFLLNLTGAEREENFTWDPRIKIYHFDAIQPMRRSVWKALDRISIWFESRASAAACDYAALSFAEARSNAEQWAKENRVA